MRSRAGTRRKLFCLLGVSLVVLGLSCSPAMACAICITLPEKTVADRILESETLVLAREDPLRPFTFAPIAVLKGSADGAPIPFLVDSATRRRLSDVFEDAVIFVRSRRSPVRPFARAEAEPEWLQLGYAGAEYRALVDQILASEVAWRADKTGRARFVFFEGLHDHPDPAIRELGLGELAKAPYGLVREMISRLTLGEIVRVLRDPKMIPWAPIHILLLGRNADPASHELVRNTVHEAATARGTQRNLAAWATALIEIDGVRAVDALARSYFQLPERSTEELLDIATAFSVHAKEGDPALRPIIIAAFHDLALARPETAPTLSVHLASLKDWSHADYFEKLLNSGRSWSPAEDLMLKVYLGSAPKKFSASELSGAATVSGRK
jgi:hypothetical protein